MPVVKNKVDRFALHRARWNRIKAGESIEKVAESEGLTAGTIRKSYLLIEEHRNLYSMPTLETHQIEMILSVQEKERKTWNEAFDARVREFHETPNGTVVTERPDHDTALSASSQITARIAALQPRSKGIVVNAQANASAAAVAGGDGKISFESKLREVIQRRQDQKEEEKAVIDVPALPAGEENDEDIGEDQAS